MKDFDKKKSQIENQTQLVADFITCMFLPYFTIWTIEKKLKKYIICEVCRKKQKVKKFNKLKKFLVEWVHKTRALK